MRHVKFYIFNMQQKNMLMVLNLQTLLQRSQAPTDYILTLLQVTSYCASVVIVLANILSDGKHIVPRLSHGGSHL